MNETNPDRLVDLVDELLNQEKISWLKFKHNNHEHKMVGGKRPVNLA